MKQFGNTISRLFFFCAEGFPLSDDIFMRNQRYLQFGMMKIKPEKKNGSTDINRTVCNGTASERRAGDPDSLDIGLLKSRPLPDCISDFG